MMVGAPLWTEILPGHQSRLFRLPWSKWQLGWNDAGIHCMLQSFCQIMRCLTTVLVCSFALLRCLKSWLLQAISLRTTSTSSSIGNMGAQSQAGVVGSHGGVKLQSHKDMVAWSPGDEKKPVVNLGLEDALEGTWIMLGHCGCQSWKRHLDTVTLPSESAGSSRVLQLLWQAFASQPLCQVFVSETDTCAKLPAEMQPLSTFQPRRFLSLIPAGSKICGSGDTEWLQADW